MAKITERPTISLQVDFTVTESEARALDGLAGYGDDAFVKVFYHHLGKAYMEKHEQGLRLFLKSVRDFIPPLLSRVDEAREMFAGEKRAVPPKAI